MRAAMLVCLTLAGSCGIEQSIVTQQAPTPASSPRIRYLGWNKPTIELVADALLQLRDDAPLDFPRATVVVPTMESGRRLKEYMARKAKGPLLMPDVALVGKLLAVDETAAASDLETQAAWMEVLLDIHENELHPEDGETVGEWKPLFLRPALGDVTDWAMGTARSLRAFRSQLEQECADKAYAEGIDAFKARSIRRDEAKWTAYFTNMGERWLCIRKLFERVDACIRRRTGKPTQEEAREQLVKHPAPRRGRLVFACLPEIRPLMRLYLRNLCEQHRSVPEIWVNVPQPQTDLFDPSILLNPNDPAYHLDAFGQPRTDVMDENGQLLPDPYWTEGRIDIPNALVFDQDGRVQDRLSTIHLVQDARAMGKKAVELAMGMHPREAYVVSCDSGMDAAIVTAFAAPAKGSPWTILPPSGRSRKATAAAALPAQLQKAAQDRHKLPTYNPQTRRVEDNTTAPLDSFLPLLRNRFLQWAFAVRQHEEEGLEGLALDSIPVHFNTCLDLVLQKQLPGSLSELEGRLADLQSLGRIINPALVNAAYSRYARWVESLVDAAAEAGAGVDPWQGFIHALRLMAANSHLLPEGMGGQAEHLAKALVQIAACCRAKGSRTPRVFISLLRYHAEREAQAAPQPTVDKDASHLDLPNWREAPYVRSRRLVVCGMHNSCVPERPASDTFLPDALRCHIGMTSSRSREARDAFLLTALLHSRPAGEVHFIVSHQQADGTPIPPSTLLLHCGEDYAELARRASHLFGEAEEPEPEPAPDAWQLIRADLGKVSEDGVETIAMLGKLPADNPYSREGGHKTFSPSRLNDFLTCPLRFWLKTLFGLSPDDAYPEDKVDLDSRDYGTEMHTILERFVADFPSRAALEERLGLPLQGPNDLPPVVERLQEDITKRAERHFYGRYGLLLGFPLRAQLTLLSENLRSFAALHARDLLDGWVNLLREFPLTPELPLPGDETPARFFMVADRIDFHPESGTWRIIDYKSSDADPDKKHYESLKEEGRFRPLMPQFPPLVGINAKVDGTHTEKLYRWTNLQLPLYAYGLLYHLKNPPEGERASEQWEAARQLCPQAWQTELQIPLLCYCSIPKNKIGAQLLPLHSRNKMSNRISGLFNAHHLESAMQWVTVACSMIRRGQCLYSAESLGFHLNFADFAALTPDHDPRSMCGLPEPGLPTPTTACHE